MTSIWKFPLSVDDRSYAVVLMPREATVISAQMQLGRLCVWAHVDTNAVVEKRTFRVFGTGWEMPSDFTEIYRFIATVQDEPFVWHVYEQQPLKGGAR